MQASIDSLAINVPSAQFSVPSRPPGPLNSNVAMLSASVAAGHEPVPPVPTITTSLPSVWQAISASELHDAINRFTHVMSLVHEPSSSTVNKYTPYFSKHPSDGVGGVAVGVVVVVGDEVGEVVVVGEVVTVVVVVADVVAVVVVGDVVADEVGVVTTQS